MQHIIFNQYNKSNQKHGFWKFSKGEDFCFEGEYCNGLKVGPWKRYDNKGRKIFTGSYHNGRKHGEWKWYYLSKKLHWEAVYKNGRYHGYYKKYWDDGHLYEEGNYIDGKMNGPWKWYHTRSDVVSCIINYKKDIPIGKTLFYNIDGSIKQEILNLT